MGDSAKKKTIRFSATNELVQLIQFDSLQARINQHSRKHHARIITLMKSTNGTWVTPVLLINQSIAFAEAISDIDANVSHDAVLQHNDASS